MKTFLHLMAYILILLHLYGCNGDVFIDDFRSSDTHLTLNGNGDSAVIRFAGANWDLLQMYTSSNSFSYECKKYDAHGKLIATERDPYLKGLGKIICEDKLTDFTIERTNFKEVKITAGENARSNHFQFVLIASNEYESQTIYVDITPSDRYVFDHITYSLNGYSYGPKTEIQKSFVQGNMWDIPYPCPLSPYEDVYHQVTFKSNMPEAFQLLGESNLTVEIPSVEDGDLFMRGEQAQYTSEQQARPFPNTEQIEVSIPPDSIQRITLLIEYEWFETEYVLYANHPTTGKQRIITGMLQSKMPRKYHIKRENIKR